MALRWVPVKSDTVPTAKEPLGDEQKPAGDPMANIVVGSADVEFALGQPSPKPAPSSPPDEDFMDAQDMEESKALKEAKRPRVPAAARNGPVVNYTPGHPPSWHFKQLFGRSESKDEEEVSGVFPSLPPVTPADQAPAEASLNSRPTPPPRPAQNAPPVALAYSSSPHASRRGSRETRKSKSTDSLSAAVKASVDGSRQDSGSTAGRAPASTVSSTTAVPGNEAQAAPAASAAAPWFSSSSGRADEAQAAASARGTMPGQQQQAGTSGSAESNVFHSTGSVSPADALVASAVTAAAAAAPTMEKKENKTSSLWSKGSAPEQQQQQAAAEMSQMSQAAKSNGRQKEAPPPALEAPADAASPAAQTSSPGERTMSLKAAAILGVTASEDAGNDGAAAAAAVAAADRALSATGSEGGGGGRTSPPRRGSFSKALSGSLPGEMLGRWRSRKGKIPASPRPGRNGNVSCPLPGSIGVSCILLGTSTFLLRRSQAVAPPEETNRCNHRGCPFSSYC